MAAASSSTPDAHEARMFLQAKGLPQLLEQYVLDCAKARPDDILTHLAEWAIHRGGKLRGAAASGCCWRVLLLGSLAARRCVADAARHSVAMPSDATRATLHELRQHFHADHTFELVPFSAESVHAVLLLADLGVSPAMIRALGVVDAVVFCAVSADGADLARKRDSVVAQELLLAHSTGLRAAVAIAVGAESGALAQLERLLGECITTCGFENKSVPVLRLAEGVGSAANLAAALMRLPAGAAAPKHGPPVLVRSAEATVVLVGGSIDKGQKFVASCNGLTDCIVDGIVCIVDKKSGKILERNPPRVDGGQVATLHVLLSNSQSKSAAAVFASAPFALVAANRVLAIGTLTKLEADDSSASEVDIPADDSSVDADDFRIDDD